MVLHLPTLSLGKKFNGLVAEMGRFGASIRGMYGEGSENYGALYEISNQKTLGMTEKEIGLSKSGGAAAFGPGKAGPENDFGEAAPGICG